MPVPGFQDFMLPVLNFTSDEKEHRLRDIIEEVAVLCKLDKEDMRKLIPSRRKPVYKDRIGWAVTYLMHAGLLERVNTGIYKITGIGKDLLNTNPSRIDIKVLESYPEFVEFRYGTSETDHHDDGKKGTPITDDKTPQEVLEDAYQNIQKELADELLNKIKNNSAEFFENLVVDLMLAMGYGGSRKDAGKSVGQSGDGGIDGIIKEDPLGLDVVYLQAKKWENSVGEPTVRDFVGALHGKGANKGVLITTSKFSEPALKFVKGKGVFKIVLIDGKKLSNLMIENNIGVATVATYETKQLDSDYFET